MYVDIFNLLIEPRIDRASENFSSQGQRAGTIVPKSAFIFYRWIIYVVASFFLNCRLSHDTARWNPDEISFYTTSLYRRTIWLSHFRLYVTCTSRLAFKYNITLYKRKQWLKYDLIFTEFVKSDMIFCWPFNFYKCYIFSIVFSRIFF